MKKAILRKTGKNCACGGVIVEVFVKKTKPFTMNTPIGKKLPSWVESDGFGCSRCGRSYGEPIFKKTEPTEQIIFALNLEEAVLKRKITLKDLPFNGTTLVPDVAQKKKQKTIRVGNTALELTPMKEVKKPLPSLLQKAKKGTKVFVVPELFGKKRLRYYHKIQFTKEKGAPIFFVTSDCLSFKN